MNKVIDFFKKFNKKDAQPVSNPPQTSPLPPGTNVPTYPIPSPQEPSLVVPYEAIPLTDTHVSDSPVLVLPVTPSAIPMPDFPITPTSPYDTLPPTAPQVPPTPSFPTEPPIMTESIPPIIQPSIPTQPTPTMQPNIPTQPTPVMQPTIPTQPTPVMQPTIPTQPTPAMQPTIPTQPTPAMQPTIPAQPTPAMQPTIPIQPTPIAQVPTNDFPTSSTNQSIPFSSLNQFVAPPELLAIASQLNTLELTKPYAVHLERLAYTSPLSKTQLAQIITPLGDLYNNCTKILSQTKDTVDLLSEYHETCLSLSRYTFPPEMPNYENFLNQNCFEEFKKELLVLLNLKKFLPTLFEDATLGLNDLTHECSIAMATFNQLTSQVTEMLPLAEKLRLEIINFSNTVTQVASQNKLSPDWDGKKQPLMQLRQQLVQKRENFVIEEEKIDAEIASLYTSCTQSHQHFCYLCPTFVKELKYLIDTTPREASTVSKRLELSSITQTLSTVHLQLEAFYNTLN